MDASADLRSQLQRLMDELSTPQLEALLAVARVLHDKPAPRPVYSEENDPLLHELRFNGPADLSSRTKSILRDEMGAPKPDQGQE